MVELNGVHKSGIRLTAAGFAWTFVGKNPTTQQEETVEVHFDFCWFRWLVADLWKMLDHRDEELAAARRLLGSRS